MTCELLNSEAYVQKYHDFLSI